MKQIISFFSFCEEIIIHDNELICLPYQQSLSTESNNFDMEFKGSSLQAQESDLSEQDGGSSIVSGTDNIK